MGKVHRQMSAVLAWVETPSVVPGDGVDVTLTGHYGSDAGGKPRTKGMHPT